MIQAPDHRLTIPSTPILDFTLADRVGCKLIHTASLIRSTIYSYPRGFEIAAPQIDEPHRIILLQSGFSENLPTISSLLLVNPEILEATDFFYNWEDCLSVNNMRANVKRPSRLYVRFCDAVGSVYEREFRGNEACDISHGIDHLNGKLFFDQDLRYFIPLSVYRPLKDQGLHILESYVRDTYAPFDPAQCKDVPTMERLGLIHARQCLKLSNKD